jgi:hypothetical protein
LLTLLGYFALQLQRETGGGLYSAGYWLLLSISIIVSLAGLVQARLARPLTLLSILLCYWVFATALRPFDGKLGSYDAAAIQAVQGKPVWMPCNFRAQQEGYRFLLPGAEVRGYYETALQTTPVQWDGRRWVALRLPLGVALDCPDCRVLGKRLQVRSRQGENEIRDMLTGNIYRHLFAQEWLVQSPPKSIAQTEPAESCR